MSTSPAFQINLQFEHRESKRARIEQHFADHPGHKYPSPWLHSVYGSSFRARVAEINADPDSPVTIHNQNFFDPQAGAEISHYWGVLRESVRRHLDLG